MFLFGMKKIFASDPVYGSHTIQNMVFVRYFSVNIRLIKAHEFISISSALIVQPTFFDVFLELMLRTELYVLDGLVWILVQLWSATDI